MDGEHISCSVYGTNRNNYNIAAGSIWNTMVSKRHDGLLSSLATKVSEFVLAMQRMHIPEAFIIPFSVMFRFFPTISEEAGSIGNAMRMRGITGKNFLKNPQAVLEYRIVPLMMSVVTIGNDLSAAALTRGLGNGKKRTSICKIGFHWKDFALMIIVTAALLVFLLF